ncbi:helix-turn-helix domain-containing protein [Halobacteriales archaeon SW_8_65_20]|nr:MAG: helix-turn-helix domain-containing protein [Halobacteriales archaeon SW_6_65_46]PSQ52877.1 MAG: helix-turn-helix domain-containing protein [Halobacteriales archaeon SW_8_65_20]
MVYKPWLGVRQCNVASRANLLTGMARARLAVTAPDGSWPARLTSEHPAARIRVRTATIGDPATLLADVIAPSLPAVLAVIAEAAGVRSLDILDRHGERAVCQISVANAGPLETAAAAGTPPAFPFVVADGIIEWELTAPHESLTTLAEELTERGLEFSVEAIRPGDDEETLLTARQRQIVRAALDGGYYEIPRGCSLADVAAATDLSKSTCSETLRRAERQLLRRYFDGGRL